MSSPYQNNPSSNKKPMDLEYINRGLNQIQQMAVYVPPEELRIQNGMLQGQETEEMHLSRKRKGLTAFLSFQLCLSITDVLKGIAVQVTVMRTGTRLRQAERGQVEHFRALNTVTAERLILKSTVEWPAIERLAMLVIALLTAAIILTATVREWREEE
jgi:hypothetical protein